MHGWAPAPLSKSWGSSAGRTRETYISTYLDLIGADSGRLPALVSELIGRGADAILAGGPELALKLATTASRTVPIVMVATDFDPLARGYVASLARPGGNVTGVFMQQVAIEEKSGEGSE